MNFAKPLVRKAKPADAAQIPAIEISSGEAFRSVPGLEWIADEGALPDERIAALIDQSASWVTEDRDGSLTGFIFCEICADTLHIAQISVRADCQKRGIGKLLIEAAFEDARHSGLSAATLTTFHDVPFNGPFYASLGFAIIKTPDLDDRLRGILAEEEASGLPIDRRCVMRMKF